MMNVKKIGVIIAVLAVLSLVTVGFAGALPTTADDNCKISIDGVTVVQIGDKVLLKAACTDGHNHVYTWKVSDPSVATIDSNGNLSGVKAGKVTVTLSDDDGHSVSKEITVGAKASSADDCKLTIEGISATKIGDKVLLKAACSDGHNHVYTWKVSDPSVATIDAAGNLTGVKAGKATVTLTDDDGHSVTKEITVVSKTADQTTQTTKSPFPILGILAGLGAAGILVLRRR